jgi:hypothetical protein
VGERGVIAAAPLFGILIGATALGGLADRYGRKQMFIIEMVLFAIFIVLLTFSASYFVVVVALVGIGLALGCDYPTAHSKPHSRTNGAGGIRLRCVGPPEFDGSAVPANVDTDILTFVPSQLGRGLRIEEKNGPLERFGGAEGITIIGEFVEAETGKGADALDRRPQLAAAPGEPAVQAQRRPSRPCSPWHSRRLA